MTTTSWKINGTSVERALTKLENAISGPSLRRWLETEEARNLRERTMTRFRQEGDEAVGGAWVPLAEVTLAIRQKMGFQPGPINVRTGDLRNWAARGDVAASGDGDNLAGVYPATVPGGELGKKVTTAQSGNSKAPARPVLALAELDVEQALMSLNHFVVREMR